MVLPITFKLDGGSPNKVNESQAKDDKLSAAPENLDEIVLVAYVSKE